MSVLTVPTVDTTAEQARTSGSGAGRPDLWLTAAVEALQDFRTTE